jgi:hypothetical protein
MRKTIAALIGAAATVTMITGAGLAAASPRTSVTRTEHFQAMSTNLVSNRTSLVAYGAFTAGGVDVQHNNNTDTFRFRGGTLHVTHKVAGGHHRFVKATCLNVITQHGTYKITRGTGRFAGATGSGHFALSIVFIAGRNSHGACSMTKKPVAGQLIIQAHGPVTLP